MRIPQKIEWRAGAILIGVSAILIGLLITLTVLRMDVGLEVEGVLRPSGEGWTLTIQAPEERIALLRRCKYIRLKNHPGYGRVASISGRLSHPSGVHTEISIQEINGPVISADSSQVLKAMLIETPKAPVLKVLLGSMFNRPHI